MIDSDSAAGVSAVADAQATAQPQARQAALITPTGEASAEALIDSFAWCREVSRRQAKNFYYGMKLTPEPKRSAMYAIYAYMRVVDDLADEEVAGISAHKQSEVKRARIDAFRNAMQQVVDGGPLPEHAPPDELWPAFRHLISTQHIDPAHLHAVIDGQLADIDGAAYQTFDQLYDYCYSVASVVGLICIEVWGYRGGEAVRKMAEHRGIALQLTNILRDLREDAYRGRVYLPAEDFERFGYDPANIKLGKADAAFDELMRFQVARARDYFAKCAALDEYIEPQCRPTSWALTKIYHELLERIAADPRAVLRKRVSVKTSRKVAIAMQAVAAGCDARLEVEGATKRPVDVAKQPVQSSEAKHVAIVGGGLAGIAAGVRLAEQGVRVSLIETRMKLGGRATSFVDPGNGQMLDNCQHVVMGCCTSLLDFYDRLGVSDRIDWHSSFYFASPFDEEDAGAFDANADAVGVDGHLDLLDRDGLIAPLHTARTFRNMKMLSLVEKLAIAKGMMAIWRMGAAGREMLSDISFETWMRQQGQPRRAIDRFWAPVVISACNETPDRTSAKYAIQVFQEGFLAHEDAYLVGLSAVPLVELYASAQNIIENVGGSVQLRSGASKLLGDSDGITGVELSDGSVIEADAVIAAVPFDRLSKLISDEMRSRDARFRYLNEFDVSPILGIHLWYQAGEKALVDLPFLSLVDSPIQWIFQKAGDGAAGERGEGVEHLHCVVSAAADMVDLSADEIVELADNEIKRFLPRARQAKLLQGRVVKEKRATFGCWPGIDHYRPDSAPDMSGIGNLYLAGDWVRSGWPATMEGAVRSGYKAASCVSGDLGLAGAHSVPDLTGSPLYRLIAR